MRPMLAAKANPATLPFPLYASAKIDGIRCLIHDGVALSRTLKPIPNRWLQDILCNPLLDGLDGELVVGSAQAANVMQTTMSGLMSREGKPDFTFWVFDIWNKPSIPFAHRIEELSARFCKDPWPSCVTFLPHYILRNLEELEAFEADTLAKGYEGVMLRKFSGLYKYGRSTLNEGYLIKLKRFLDNEAIVVGWEELMHNANEAEEDNLGLTKRSTHIANKIPMNTLGALYVRDLTSNIPFNIGTGFTAAQRQQLWDMRHTLKGKIVKYKYFSKGIKTAPRFPVWLGFRDPIDFLSTANEDR